MMSPGAITGIVLGVIVLIILSAVAAYFLMKKSPSETTANKDEGGADSEVPASYTPSAPAAPSTPSTPSTPAPASSGSYYKIPDMDYGKYLDTMTYDTMMTDSKDCEKKCSANPACVGFTYAGEKCTYLRAVPAAVGASANFVVDQGGSKTYIKYDQARFSDAPADPGMPMPQKPPKGASAAQKKKYQSDLAAYTASTSSSAYSSDEPVNFDSCRELCASRAQGICGGFSVWKTYNADGTPAQHCRHLNTTVATDPNKTTATFLKPN
jgi:hypothetical protein